MDIVYLQEDKKFITIPDGDVATHEQIRDFFYQREQQMKATPPSSFNNLCKYFSID